MLPQACFPRAWLLPKGSSTSAAPWWADTVFCCAGARFRTAGLEDAGQPALGSSPEPQQLSEDKPQVLAQPFPPTLPTLGSGMRHCQGGWHLPLCCPSLAVGSLTPGKATWDGSCRSSGGQGSQWLLWNPSGYSWMLGWHLYRPIEKSWKLSLGIHQSLQPLETPPTKPPFLFSWRWVRDPGWGSVEPSLHGWAGTCSCGESFTLLFSGGLCV